MPAEMPFLSVKLLTKAQLCEGEAASCCQAVNLRDQAVMMALRPQLEHGACTEGWSFQCEPYLNLYHDLL